MKRLVYTTVACGLLAAIPIALAQQAGDERATGGHSRTKARAKSRAKNAATNSVVARMMAFDENRDGQLTKDEVTDERLHRLFDRADANHDGTVTRRELTALASREPAGNRGGFGPPPGGPGRFGMGPPRSGEVLPPILRSRLELTPEQSKQVDVLQKEVDARLDRILTADQRAQLKQMRERGPGGPGGRGGPGGFGPSPGGGPPPGGFGPPPGRDGDAE